MARFFRRKDSEVIERMSEERTGSPNIWWSNEQLAIHGFREVTDVEQKAEDQKVKDAAEKEALITAKIREQAVTSLKAEGKLDASGNIAKVK